MEKLILVFSFTHPSARMKCGETWPLRLLRLAQTWFKSCWRNSMEGRLQVRHKILGKFFRGTVSQVRKAALQWGGIAGRRGKGEDPMDPTGVAAGTPAHHWVSQPRPRSSPKQKQPICSARQTPRFSTSWSGFCSCFYSKCQGKR